MKILLGSSQSIASLPPSNSSLHRFPVGFSQGFRSSFEIHGYYRVVSMHKLISLISLYTAIFVYPYIYIYIHIYGVYIYMVLYGYTVIPSIYNWKHIYIRCMYNLRTMYVPCTYHWWFPKMRGTQKSWDHFNHVDHGDLGIPHVWNPHDI